MAAGDITDELVSRVRRRLGGAATDGMLTADITRFLNLAQHDLAWRLDDASLPGLAATSTGTASDATAPAPAGAIEAALPTDLLRERTVLCGDIQARRLKVSELDTTVNSYRTPSDDEPQYLIWNGMLYVIAGDTSDHTYTLHYIQAPANMDTDTDPLLGERHHNLLVNITVARAREMKGRPAEQQRLLAEVRNDCKLRNSRWGARMHENIPGDPARERG